MSQTIKLEIAKKIMASRHLAITSHLRPDGDSIYTSLALAEMLDLLGKKVQVVNRDPLPFPFNEFPETARIRRGQIEPEGVDLVILLECVDVSRSGQTGIDHLPKINIDHHYSNSPYADLNWIDPEASAVGEMVYELLEPLGLSPTPKIAEFLYAAIFSDTGSFQFSNTTARALYTCYCLARAGANPNAIAEKLLNNNTAAKVQLLGRVLTGLKMNPAGNLALLAMFQRDLKEVGLKDVDLEDITTIARSIKGVEMVIFFKEMEPGVFRVSLRSKGQANSALVAESYGGGGHMHAAGFTVYGEYEKLAREIPLAVEEILNKNRGRD
ncbi:MAG: bifunctional oligoribonuclease/PAP phosphatase NrnA [Candidatus Saccharicenans sp.]|nr:bifunctional oligoribonuclease/PAP phosphatase NrnA [Candidatus Saccharicenans sp.]MDI6849042.1 bifunctional oligoribonuclease/PAP phosphatase NrnA [Candidatus Saccharicenans sp.]